MVKALLDGGANISAQELLEIKKKAEQELPKKQQQLLAVLIDRRANIDAQETQVPDIVHE